MKKDELNETLREYHRVVAEGCNTVGTQMHRSIASGIMCLAVFLTFIGGLMTQLDEIILSFNLITVGIAVIGIILFLVFISCIGYYFFLRIHLHNISGTARDIEKLQQDILFEKISQEDLEKRFEEVCPFLNDSEYRMR